MHIIMQRFGFAKKGYGTRAGRLSEPMIYDKVTVEYSIRKPFKMPQGQSSTRKSWTIKAKKNQIEIKRKMKAKAACIAHEI